METQALDVSALFHVQSDPAARFQNQPLTLVTQAEQLSQGHSQPPVSTATDLFIIAFDQEPNRTLLTYILHLDAKPQNHS